MQDAEWKGLIVRWSKKKSVVIRRQWTWNNELLFLNLHFGQFDTSRIDGTEKDGYLSIVLHCFAGSKHKRLKKDEMKNTHVYYSDKVYLLLQLIFFRKWL